MKKLLPILFFVYLCGISIYAYYKPFYNWDMIPYIAAAHSFEQHDKKQLHDKVYEEVKKSVPSHVYTELTQGDYRQTMLNDVEAFYQQLPFYKPKLLYVWLIHALTQLGFNSITAMSILSVTTSFIASLMILLFLLHETSGIYPYVFSVLIINISGLLDVARLFTPDALSACISLLAIFLLLKKKNIWVVIVLAVASIWVRVDNLLFFLLIFTYLHFFSFKDYRIATIIYFVSIALCATSYIIINYGITNYGWSTLIYHITVNKIITPENFQSPLSFLDYIVILIKRWLIQFVTNPLLSFFLVTGFSTGYLFRLINRDSKIFIYGHITIIMALSIVIHFVLFPDLLNRYFVTQYGLGAIAFSITLYHFIQSRQTHLFEQETPIS